MTAQARFATPRNPSRRTLSGEVVAIMRTLGFEPMPWQTQVLDVAYEVDDAGELVYREVDLIVPRQAGKTALLLAVQVHRALKCGGKQASMYIAQGQTDTRDKFLKEHVPVIRASVFGKHIKVRESNGSEGLEWSNGSRHTISAPTSRAGHGRSLDLTQIDEAFALRDSLVEQGLKPTMITRRNAQMWVVSAAGTDQSTYLIGKRDRGREMALLGVDEGVAYFEWSASDDMDSSDPATWEAVHPAIGHTIRAKDLLADFHSMEPQEFERAYLARWPSSHTERLIPEKAWAAVLDPASHRDPSSRIAFGVDATVDRDMAAIGMTAMRPDGLPHVEVVQHRPGTLWLVDALLKLKANFPDSVFAIDGRSPAASIIPQLESEGLEVTQLGMRDVVRATGALYDSIQAGGIRHRGQQPLDDAVAGAGKRKLGESWTWARTYGSDISPLVAVTLASYALSTAQEVVKETFDWEPWDL